MLNEMNGNECLGMMNGHVPNTAKGFRIMQRSARFFFSDMKSPPLFTVSTSDKFYPFVWFKIKEIES